MKRAAALLLALFLLPLPVRAAGVVHTSASAAVLMDGESGRVLYAYCAQERRPIASITKLMTALVAAELCPDLSQKVTIRREWTGIEGSSMYLKPGEQLTVEELLYGLLLSSGNDAAAAIAGLCCGSQEAFAARMNEKAAALGMEDTHFTDPSGLDDQGQWSTAYDVALLARAVLAREDLSAIAATRTTTAAGRYLANHNKLLWRYDGCTGLKTGYTERAGRTLVSSAQQDGQTLIAVTLSDPNDWADHARLLDYGFEIYPRRLVLEGGRRWLVPCAGSLCPFAEASAGADLYYPLAEGERLELDPSLAEGVQAPVAPGTQLGTARLTLNGETVLTVPLTCRTGVLDDRAPAGLLERIFGGG